MPQTFPRDQVESGTSLRITPLFAFSLFCLASLLLPYELLQSTFSTNQWRPRETSAGEHLASLTGPY